MIDEIEDAEDVQDSQIVFEIESFTDVLLRLEEVNLNLFPTDKREIQATLIKLIKQRLEFLDYESED
jgi:nicotinate-nucleotide pyrophosphorylase